MIKEATEIVKTLQDGGYDSYFAGGAVRDILMQKEPADIDIATSAKPEEIERLFENTISIGKQFGVILVRNRNHDFEVATFREEGPYSDKRRPDYVRFTSAENDAKRRDFTINGMFYDPIKQEVIDFVDGQNDLKQHTIRFIGNAGERINEDNLRLIRAIRFKVALNFQYAPQTLETISKHACLIKNVAPERVRDELNKVFSSSRRHIGFAELTGARITDHILPEVNDLKGVPQPIEYHHEGDVYTHTYLALKSLPPDAPLHLVWAVMLHDIAKPQTMIKENGRIIFHNHAEVSAEKAKKILTRLRFSKIEISTICWLIESHMKIGLIDKMRSTKKMAFLLDPRFPDLIALAEADSKGTYPVNLELVAKLKHDLEQAKKHKAEIDSKIKQTKLFTGDNLISLGYNPSKEFQKILDEVNDHILSGEINNTQEAESFVLKRYKK